MKSTTNGGIGAIAHAATTTTNFVTPIKKAIAIFATKFKTMTALFIILAVVRLAQLLLVGAFAAGHQWCLTAFFVVTVILAVADLVMFITVHITNKEVERREP